VWFRRYHIGGGDIRLNSSIVPKKEIFHYLISMLQKNGDIDKNVSRRIKIGWLKWCQGSGVLCDPRVPLKLKSKFYRTTIRSAMSYEVECWPTKRRHAQQLSVAEMRMLPWIRAHTRRDRVRNDDMHEQLGVAPVNKKHVQHRLRWFRYIQRRPAETPIQSRVIRWTGLVKKRWTCNGRRDRERPNLILEESIKKYLNDWSIIKERIEARNSCIRILILSSFYFIAFLSDFFMCWFSLFCVSWCSIAFFSFSSVFFCFSEFRL
jgi:hypothetical protein